MTGRPRQVIQQNTRHLSHSTSHCSTAATNNNNTRLWTSLFSSSLLSSPLPSTHNINAHTVIQPGKGLAIHIHRVVLHLATILLSRRILVLLLVSFHDLLCSCSHWRHKRTNGDLLLNCSLPQVILNLHLPSAPLPFIPRVIRELAHIQRLKVEGWFYT